MRELEASVSPNEAYTVSPGSRTTPSSVGASRDHCLYGTGQALLRARSSHVAHSFCFDVLSAKLNGQDLPKPDFPDQNSEYPLFVTWNIESSRGGHRLRGCIGNFEPQNLGEGLAEYAIIAAMRDHRFSPITLKEVTKLQCGVSLLTNFEECTDPYDWVLGTHGIYIHVYEDNNKTRLPFKRRRSNSKSPSLIHRGPGILTATFLPDVAPAQGWDQIETLNAAIRKAGWSGRIDEAVRASLRVVRYRSTRYELEYSDWLANRGYN